IPDVINEGNVERVQAKIIVEAANIPMKYEIERILHEKGVLVIPDIIANAGGVISSYAEYVGENPTRMYEIVRKRIAENTRLILKEAAERNLPPRDIAMEKAMRKVKEAMEKSKIKKEKSR
ncbi:Glu/Leu/Phe/Val dehydrogenase, partial [Candidatus Bathyarchaeota archaeon]|nr:Glu/Leu/Phe/Val dehydrogenase [Candidatus Bathyarchaeota archaeon]